LVTPNGGCKKYLEAGKGKSCGGTKALKSKADIIYIPLFQREQQSVQLKSRI